MVSKTAQSQVCTGAKTVINRDTVDLNEPVLKPILSELGMRVGVEVLSFQVEAFFEMLNIPLKRT